MKGRSPESQLVRVVSVAIFLDTLFYAVITPLLPQLTHELHLSKFSAGVLTASYAAGMLAASLPAGALAVRRGPRFTLITGISLLVISTVAFGLLNSAAALGIARFVEGIGGACSWAGGLAWIVSATPASRRGAVMGQALGTSIAGALFGPAFGALATVVGRGVLFCALAALTSLLLIPIRALPDQHVPSQQSISDVLRVLRKPALAAAMWLMMLPAIISGLFNVLGPLQLHELGAGAGVIGFTFLASAGIEALISPVAGRFSDRHDRMLPLRGALVTISIGLACFTLPTTAAVLCALMIVTFSMLGVFWAPVMALVADVSEANGIDQAHAAALMNLAWAAGQIVGSGVGGAFAKAFGDAVPTLGVAGLCLLTLAGLRRPSTARGPAQAPDPSV
jgi:MFS family permease